MGQGEFVLTNCLNTFKVHSCHQPIRPGISVTTAFAIESWHGVVKIFRNGMSAIPAGVTVAGNTITFGGGAVVVVQLSDVAGSLTVKLPATCCGNVEGLCGHFNPDADFEDIFTNSSGMAGHYPANWWGGPYGGAYQTEFAHSFKLSASDADALFTAAECASGDPDEPDEPPEPFEDCPELEADAREQCPEGRFQQNCLIDVGVTCNLTVWVNESKAAEEGFEEVDDGSIVVHNITGGCLLVHVPATVHMPLVRTACTESPTEQGGPNHVLQLS